MSPTAAAELRCRRGGRPGSLEDDRRLDARVRPGRHRRRASGRTHPLCGGRRRAGIPIWGEVELAWRIDRCGRLRPPRQWLVVTGHQRQDHHHRRCSQSILRRCRVRRAWPAATSACRCSTRWSPRCAAASMYLAVELSSASSCTGRRRCGRRRCGAQHRRGSSRLARRRWRPTRGQGEGADRDVAVAGLDDPVAAELLDRFARGRRTVGFTARRTGDAGELGVSTAMSGRPRRSARSALLAAVDDVDVRPGPHGVTDALAAAALARAVGCRPDAVARRTATSPVGRHRSAPVGRRRRGALHRRLEGDQSARRAARCWRTIAWCGSPAACSRAPSSTTWCEVGTAAVPVWCSSDVDARR